MANLPVKDREELAIIVHVMDFDMIEKKIWGFEIVRMSC